MECFGVRFDLVFFHVLHQIEVNVTVIKNIYMTEKAN